jgi:nucleotide-binding universal stress UspA family protein
MEIAVSPYAPVVGRQIRDLRATNWLIASVYREGELIIPHADTLIHPNDRITIVGHTDLYAAIAHLFKYEEPSFPLAYGQNILAAIEDIKSFKMILPEAYYLVKNTRAQRIILLVPKPQKETIAEEVRVIGEPIEPEIREFQEKLKDEIILTSYRESIGCVLVPPTSPGILTRIFSQFIPIVLAHKLASPLLIPRNTHPYKRILVPYNATQRSALALEISIDIARQTGADISVVVVSEPDVIRGEVSKDWSEKALNHAREIAQIYKFPVKEIKLEGNPVREVITLTKDVDLLVLGSTTQEVPFLKPHVGELLIEKSPCSVMVIAH